MKNMAPIFSFSFIGLWLQYLHRLTCTRTFNSQDFVSLTFFGVVPSLVIIFLIYYHLINAPRYTMVHCNGVPYLHIGTDSSLFISPVVVFFFLCSSTISIKSSRYCVWYLNSSVLVHPSPVLLFLSWFSFLLYGFHVFVLFSFHLPVLLFLPY